jgi:hypothetical protein
MGCIIAVVCVVCAPILVVWLTHLGMITDNCREYKFPIKNGTFVKFKREMSKREWVRDPLHPTSFFCKHETFEEFTLNYVHVSIFVFDGVGMRFINPIDCVLVELWLLIHKHKK